MCIFLNFLCCCFYQFVIDFKFCKELLLSFFFFSIFHDNFLNPNFQFSNSKNISFLDIISFSWKRFNNNPKVILGCLLIPWVFPLQEIIIVLCTNIENIDSHLCCLIVFWILMIFFKFLTNFTAVFDEHLRLD